MILASLLFGSAALVLIAARVYLLPYLVWGPQAFDDMAGRADQKLIAGGLAAAAIALACLPTAASALISPAPAVQVSA